MMLQLEDVAKESMQRSIDLLKEAPFRIQPLQLMNDPMFPDRLVNDI